MLLDGIYRLFWLDKLIGYFVYYITFSIIVLLSKINNRYLKYFFV